jgi:hypothetical protein
MSKVRTLFQHKALGFFLSTSNRNVFLPISINSFKNHHMLRSRVRYTNAFQTSCALFHQSTGDRNENSTDHDLDLDSKQLPRLMNEPINIKLHSLSKGFSYVYKVRDVIKPDFDPEFDVDDFEMGVKHAVFTVSSLLAKGDFESLKELFDPDALSEVERNLSKFVPDQRLSLPSNPKDFQRCFIYDIETKGGLSPTVKTNLGRFLTLSVFRCSRWVHRDFNVFSLCQELFRNDGSCTGFWVFP